MTQTTNRRPLAQVPLTDLPRQLRVDADEMNGWGACNEAEHARQAADEIERLRDALAEEDKFWERFGPGAGAP